MTIPGDATGLRDRFASRDRVVVLDLEFTAWEGSQRRGWSGPGEHREIVQVGAVRICPARGFTEEAALSLIVRPRINPWLSAYFIDLTGITQDRLDREAVDFPTALAAFQAFAGPDDPILSNGHDGAVVAENCALNTLPCPIPPARFVDVGRALADAAGVPGRIGSGALHRHFPGVPDLPAHDALADARMVAAALAAVVGDRVAFPSLRRSDAAWE